MRTPEPSTIASSAAAAPAAARVWVLMGHRAGDNAQLQALAERLGCPFEIKRFVPRRLELATNLLFDASLLGRIGPRSSPPRRGATPRNRSVCARWGGSTTEVEASREA